MTTQPSFDQDRAEAFAGQVIGYVNGASVALMISIGNQTGLFDKMAEIGPSTSEAIASAAGLNERYVRECLGALVTGRVVEYEPASKSYHLPPEHAAFLTHAAGIDNLGTMTQFIAMLAEVEPQIVKCFREGGGVPYTEYTRFHRLMREDSAQTFGATLIDVALPLVPNLVDKLRAGIEVADVGCGAGHAVNLMAKAFPNSRFIGYDISEEGIAMGRAEAQAWGLTNAGFEVKDAARLAIHERFDLITTFDAIHDQAHPATVLSGIYEALKPGGTYFCIDVAASSNLEENLEHMLAPFIYTVSAMHCMTVSLAYGGDGLGAAWGEQLALKMMSDAGFKDIETRRVEGDLFNNYYIASK